MYFSPEQLKHIDSMTKYPSIETYHKINPSNGKLLDERIELPDPYATVIATEKVDGVNARIVTFPNGDWIIGSRKELLTCKGDRIANPTCGIVDAVRVYAEHIADRMRGEPAMVFYGEVYGGDDTVSPRWKNYTETKGMTGFVVFDVQSLWNYHSMCHWTVEFIAAWRKHGGQQFLHENTLQEMCKEIGFGLTPRIAYTTVGGLPSKLQDMLDWMANILPYTNVAIGNGLGDAEGVVLRTEDRKFIAKARFQEYRRSLKAGSR